MDGQVPAKVTWPEWIARQSVERQQEALGVAKTRLFRQGKLSIDKFSTRDGRPLTLSELENRHPDAWERAFGKAA